LVVVDFTEPNEFIIEILGQRRSNKSPIIARWFQSLERITEDPPSQATLLHHRLFLHAAQHSRLAAARAAKPEPPKAAPPPPPPAAPTAASVDRDKVFALSWSLGLSDTRITLEQTNALDLVTAAAPRTFQRNPSWISSTGIIIGCRRSHFRAPPAE
jgi:hypothetical protein